MQVTEIEDRIPVIEDSMSRIMQQQVIKTLCVKKIIEKKQDFLTVLSYVPFQSMCKQKQFNILLERAQ